MRIIFIFISIFPSFIGIPLRRLFGYKIGKNCKISPFVFILSNKVIIDDNVVIAPFVIIRTYETHINSFARISTFSYFSTKSIDLSQYSHISSFVIILGDIKDKSDFRLGKHSSIFPFSWIDTTKGVYIGNQVGIGGHSLIFTHGTWPNFLKGAPVSFGTVIIEDNVWLAWRVFIMPGVIIGTNSIISANSTVFKSIPSNSLAAGSPARIISTDSYLSLSDSEMISRWKIILMDFMEYDKKRNWEFKGQDLTNTNYIITRDFNVVSNKKIFYVNLLTNSELNRKTSDNQIRYGYIIDIFNNIVFNHDNNEVIVDLVSFLRRYGIRLDLEK